MPVIVSCLLVLAGAVMILTGALNGRKITAYIPPELRKKWRIMLGLMLLLFVCYLAADYILAKRTAVPAEVIIDPVFLLGAVFVFMVINMTGDMLRQLKSVESQLRLMNGQLEQHVQERTRELQKSHSFMETVLDSLHEGVMIIDVDTFMIRGANASLLRQYGLSHGEVVGRTCYGVTHQSMDVCAPPNSFCPLMETVKTGRFASAEHVHRDSNGREIHVEVSTAPIPGLDGSVGQVVHVSRDITELREKEEKLRYLANYDPLTSLPNRTLFFDRLDQLLALSKRNRFALAVLYIDLDRFKNVNDRLGHDAGDQLLREVSKRLISCVREEDTVARVGGDEFVVICAKIDDAGNAVAMARRITDVLSLPFHICKSACSIGASIGIGLYPQDGESGEELLSRADTAMYHVKESGKGGWFLYRDMNGELTSRSSDLSHTPF